MTALDIMRQRLPEDDAVTAAEAEVGRLRKRLETAQDAAWEAHSAAEAAYRRALPERRHNALRALAEEARALGVGVHAAVDAPTDSVRAVVGIEVMLAVVEHHGRWRYRVRWTAHAGAVNAYGATLRLALEAAAADVRRWRWRGKRALALVAAVEALPVEAS